jgi:type IV pilus assembly protein PilC
MVVVSIIVLRVVPEFGAFYEQFDEELPLSTQMIVAVSDFARSYSLVLLAGVVGLAVAFYAWLQQPAQRERFDRLILQVPGLGTVARKFATSQASRTLATLLGGGIPLVNAIDVAARAIKNRYIARELQAAGQQVREGRALSAAMAESGAFADVAVKMVEVGESTGALQDMLSSLAEFYDEEVETEVERVTKLIEPAMLVFMGIVIAAVVLALYLPLFELTSVVGA